MDSEETNPSRREFLLATAAGTLGALALPGCMDASAAAPGAAGAAGTPRTVTVIGAIDIAQVLADNSLDDNIFWVDNNASVGSRNQGTSQLRTALRPGDIVQWVVSGLEVETVADILSISGAGAAVANPVETAIMPGVKFWTGKIAIGASGVYAYDVALKIENRLFTAASRLSLEVLTG